MPPDMKHIILANMNVIVQLQRYISQGSAEVDLKEGSSYTDRTDDNTLRR